MNVFFDPTVHFDPAGKVIADLSAKNFEFSETLLAKGAECAYAVADKDDFPVPRSDKVVTVRAKPWEFKGSNIDLAFLDPREIDGFDYVDDVTRVLACIEEILSPAGQAFVVLRTGTVQTDWDVYNSVNITPVGALPTSPFLFETMLADFAVRPLKRLQSGTPQFSVDRIFRVSRRKPNLLLIVGHSQAGKTTLARDLIGSGIGTHVSSDYLFYDLLRIKRAGGAMNQTLADLINDGSFENAGEFFRGVESSKQTFLSYLEIVASALPHNKRLVSIDMDLRRVEFLDDAKSFFAERGYSSWVVTR